MEPYEWTKLTSGIAVPSEQFRVCYSSRIIFKVSCIRYPHYEYQYLGTTRNQRYYTYNKK